MHPPPVRGIEEGAPFTATLHSVCAGGEEELELVRETNDRKRGVAKADTMTMTEDEAKAVLDELVAKDEKGRKVILLYNSMQRDQLQVTATRKIITQLEGMQNEGAALLQAGVIKVDGMGEGYDAWGGTDVKGPEDHKPVRKACWTLSGLGPGSYPILMIGSTYLIGGSGDDIQGMIDSGAMKKALFGA